MEDNLPIALKIKNTQLFDPAIQNTARNMTVYIPMFTHVCTRTHTFCI